MNETIINQLVNYRKKKGLSVPKAAQELNIPADRIYKWEQGHGNPKGADIDKIKAWLEEVPSIKLEQKINPDNPDALKVIYILAENNKTLSESNKVLVESNKIIVESNKVLADSNQELVLLAKQAFNLNLEKLLKAGQQQHHPNKEHPKGPSEKLPLRSRLANKNKTEIADK